MKFWIFLYKIVNDERVIAMMEVFVDARVVKSNRGIEMDYWCSAMKIFFVMTVHKHTTSCKKWTNYAPQTIKTMWVLKVAVYVRERWHVVLGG